MCAHSRRGAELIRREARHPRPARSKPRGEQEQTGGRGEEREMLRRTAPCPSPDPSHSTRKPPPVAQTSAWPICQCLHCCGQRRCVARKCPGNAGFCLRQTTTTVRGTHRQQNQNSPLICTTTTTPRYSSPAHARLSTRHSAHCARSPVRAKRWPP